MESICVLFRLSLSLLLSLSLAKLCPLHSTNDLLQTGIIAMSGNADANNCVSADITYPIADRSVTGIGSIINFGNINLSNGLDYAITGRPAQNITTQFTFMLLININFAKVMLSYLIESRKDVLVGNFIVDTSDTFDCSYTGVTKLSYVYRVPYWIPVPNDISNFLATFISGMKSSAPTYEISHASSLYLATGLITTVFTFGASASIEHIKIAFVIVFNSDFLVPSYQEGTSVYANYYWLGMKGETGTTIINGTVTLNIDRLSCVGDLCPADCVTKRDCESISGTFVSYNRTCMVCRVNMSYINGACQCNKNSYIRNGSCYGCWPHAYATNDGTNCTCASPYIADTLNYKTCVLVNTNCGKGSTFNITTQSCQCIYTNGIINPKTSDCQCGVNMVLNSESTACVCDSLSYIYALTCIKCWNNSSPNAQLTSCNCNSGFYRSFENPRLCITQTQCFDNAFFNATIEGCQCLYPSQHLGATACVCPYNRVLDPVTKLCVCDSSSYKLNNDCIKCWYNSIVTADGLGCTCNSASYAPVGTTQKCVLKPLCVGGVFNVDTLKCICTNPTMILKYDQLTCACPAGQQVFAFTGKCACIDNYYVTTDSTCLPCWTNSILNSAKTGCVCINNTYQPPGKQVCVTRPTCLPTVSFFNYTSEKCQCLYQGQLYDSNCNCSLNMVVNTSNICDCAPNAYPDPVNKGQCLACWENAIYNATTSTCECQPGYYLSVPKTCTIRPSCLNGAKFDYAKKTCVCVNVGQVIINNKCVCPAGQVYSYSAQKCQCPTNSYWNGTTCIQCWRNSATNIHSTGCDCLDGYYTPPGQTNDCEMVPDCGQNSRYDHTVNSCVCIITGMIQGTGTEGCTCPANMVLNEILATCVCNQVSYLLKGLCVECWSNARPVADQSTCVCQDTFYETSPEVCEPSPLLTASGMACKPIPEDLLQSGIMTFTASNLKNVRENCLNVQINFNPPNNGISNIVSVMDFGTLLASSGVDYSVSGKVKDTTFGITLLIKSGWMKIRVSYLLSGRPEIYLGSFIADTSLTYTCNDSGNTLINSSAIIPNWDSHSKNSVSAIYICLSGLKTTLSTIIFKQNATLDTVTGLLSLGFNFSTPGATIDFIKISYAIFLHSAFDLAVVKTIVDLADYSLTAAIGLNSGLPTLSTLNINAQRYSCNSPACPDICVNKPTCLTNKGNIYNRGCYICGLKQIWNGIKCVCYSRMYLLNGSCVNCPQGQIPNAEQTNCVTSNNSA